MSILAAYSVYSLFRRLLPVLGKSEIGSQRAPTSSFWLKQAIKLAILIFALTQVKWILKRVV